MDPGVVAQSERCPIRRTLSLATEYQVTLSPGGRTVTLPPTHGVGGRVLNRYFAAEVGGLTQGATYTFRVRARIGNGAWGLLSAPVVLHGAVNVLDKPGRPDAARITLHGKVTDADTHRPINEPGLVVPVVSRPIGSAKWDSTGDATLNKDGTYSITLPYKPNREYMAQFPGVVGTFVGPWYSGSDSAIVRVP